MASRDPKTGMRIRATTAIGVAASTNGIRRPRRVSTRSDHDPIRIGRKVASRPSIPISAPITVGPASSASSTGRYVVTVVAASASPKVGSPSRASDRRWARVSLPLSRAARSLPTSEPPLSAAIARS